MNTPILILIFNRPKETKKLVKRLEKFKPKNIYVFSDGPRKNNFTDIELNNQCKLLIQNINWKSKIKKKYLKNNSG